MAPRKAIVYVILAIALTITPHIKAQPSPARDLFAKMPPETFFGVATSGMDYLQPRFDQSSLGKLWNDPGVQQFVDQIKQSIFTLLTSQADENIPLDEIKNMVKLLSRCPIAAGIVEIPNIRAPYNEAPLYGFVMVDAGDKKQQIQALVEKFEALAKPGDLATRQVGMVKLTTVADSPDAPISWGWNEETFVIMINDRENATLKSMQKPASRRALARKIPRSLKDNGDLLLMNCDFQVIAKIVANVMAQEDSPKTVAKVKSILTRLGLTTVQSLTVRAGFDGPNIVAESCLKTSAPPSGVLALAKPIDLAAFDKVEASAVNASAWNLSLAGTYDLVMDVLKAETSPETMQQINTQIDMIEQQIGLKIRSGLLASIDGPMVAYSLPAFKFSEAPAGGGVLMAKLKDPAAFQQNMTALGTFAQAIAQGNLQISTQQTASGQTLNNWTIPPLAMLQVMPTWTVVKNDLIIATNPAVAQRTIKTVSATGSSDSIRSLPAFKTMEASLPENIIGLQYTDSKTQIKQMHTQLQQFWPMLTMMLTNTGIQLPAMLPSIDEAIKDMPPSYQYAWIQPDGIYTHYSGSGVQGSGAAVGGGAAGLAILMPALNKARNQAKTMVSLSNLKNLGTACYMYSEDHDGKFPPDLETLKQTAVISAESLESPRKPKGFQGPDYIYISGQTKSSADPQNSVLAYENPEFAGEKIPVLFVDGHAEIMNPQQFQQKLNATKERLKQKI